MSNPTSRGCGEVKFGQMRRGTASADCPKEHETLNQGRVETSTEWRALLIRPEFLGPNAFE